MCFGGMEAGLSAIGGGGSAIGGVASIFGQVAGGYAQQQQASAAGILARSDADAERWAAGKQADRILQETRRQRGAAAAATAASGTRLDEFSLINDRSIVEAGESDAAMAILGGNQRARALELQASQYESAGRSALYGSLFSSAATSIAKGWKGVTPMTRDEWVRAEKASY